MWIRNTGWKKFRIRDKHPGSATLVDEIKFVSGKKTQEINELFILSASRFIP
jgi:hypothetical protein